MNKSKNSLICNIKKIVVLPLICLSIVILGATTWNLYASMSKETRVGLQNLAHTLHKICDSQAAGNYTMQGDILFKGNTPISEDLSLVDDIYKVSGVDATLFFEDKRILTTVRNPDGTRAVGTNASNEVVEQVLLEKQEFFSNRVMVNETAYFGYYLPLQNEDGSVAGMVFVGKARSMVMNAMLKSVAWVFCLTVVAAILASTLAMSFAKKIIDSLNKTKEFLGSVAQGNVDISLEAELLERKDELGEMGRFSVMLQHSITELVGTDTLTGLYNRRSGLYILENVMREYQKHDTLFTVVMADIDNFKRVNDQYGHDVGDCVLKSIASVFREYVGRKGFALRWGGEEFLLIYERIGKTRVQGYLEELQAAIQAINMIQDGKRIPITVTFGGEDVKGYTNIEELIKKADQHLYYGKEHGKNCIVLDMPV